MVKYNIMTALCGTRSTKWQRRLSLGGETSTVGQIVDGTIGVTNRCISVTPGGLCDPDKA